MNLYFLSMNIENKTITSKLFNTMQAENVKRFKDSIIFSFATNQNSLKFVISRSQK